MASLRSRRILSRLKITSGVLAVLFLLVSFLLPTGVRILAESRLEAAGATGVGIDNVDLDLLAGTFGVDGLRFVGPGGSENRLERFRVDLAMKDLFRKRVRLESVSLSGLALFMDGDTPAIGGIPLQASDNKTTPAKAEKESGWGVVLDGVEVHDFRLHLAASGIRTTLELERLSLSGLSTVNPERNVTLDAAGRLHGASFKLKGSGTPLKATPEGKGDVLLTDLDLSFLASLLPEGVSASGLLTVDSRFGVLLSKERMTLFQEGRVRVSKMRATCREPSAVLEKGGIEWDGRVDLSVNSGKPDLKSSGAITLEDLALALSSPNVRISQKKGRLSLDGDMKGAAIESFRADLVLEEGEGETGGGEAFFRFSRLAAERVVLEGGILSVDGILGRGVGVFLVRKEDGTTMPLATLRAASSGDGKTEPAEAAPGTRFRLPFPVVLEKLDISGSPVLSFTDKSVTPNVEGKVDLETFRLGRIDTRTPEADVPVTLRAQTGAHESVSLHGQIRPLAPESLADVTLRVENVGLVPLSPYVTQATGYRVRTGTFGLESRIRIENGTLQAENEAILTGIDLEPEDADGVARMVKSVAMPLDMALSLLKDRDDVIRLSVPLAGSLNDPEIRLGKAVARAATRALTLASVSYLKYAIQPYGAIVAIAETTGSLASRIRLDSVAFEPGGLLPEAEGLAYLETVAGLLEKKAALRLTLCADATPLDFPEGGDESAMMALAASRNESLRDFFVERGIQPGRLLLCNPKIAEGANRLAVAELGL